MARELIVTPPGTALWAKVLSEPVAYEDSPKAWSISLLLDPALPDTVGFVERLERVFEEFHGAKAKIAANGWPFSDDTTKDAAGKPVPTGKLKFNFKRKQLDPRGNVKDPPLVVDRNKNTWPADQLIGNGSTVKVAFSPWKWEGLSGQGMSLELESLQVLDLVPLAVRSAADIFD